MLPYFPLEYGLLTGKYRRGEPAPAGSRAERRPERARWLERADWDSIEALTAYAAERDLTMLDVAIAGLAAQPTVASVIAGATSGDQVRANAAALRWEPTEADLVELDEITASRPTSGQATWSDRFDRPIQKPSITCRPGSSGSVAAPRVTKSGV